MLSASFAKSFQIELYELATGVPVYMRVTPDRWLGEIDDRIGPIRADCAKILKPLVVDAWWILSFSIFDGRNWNMLRFVFYCSLKLSFLIWNFYFYDEPFMWWTLWRNFPTWTHVFFFFGGWGCILVLCSAEIRKWRLNIFHIKTDNNSLGIIMTSFFFAFHHVVI